MEQDVKKSISQNDDVQELNQQIFAPHNDDGQESDQQIFAPQNDNGQESYQQIFAPLNDNGQESYQQYSVPQNNNGQESYQQLSSPQYNVISEEEKQKKENKIILIVVLCVILLLTIIFGLIISIKSCTDSIFPGTDGEKPIIYLYPEKETKVSVELTAADRIICSYPKYDDAWNVLAQPDGNLTDLKTGKSLYALYYENVSNVNFRTDDGFIVKGEDSAAFLEEKLAVLGLNDREAEEFIVYWLPKLEANRYNYIRFADQQEIEENMPLKITPKPDTEIRVLMLYKGLDQPKEIKEQKLIPQTRTGFTVVEWGGTILQ